MARIAQGTVCKFLAEQEVKPHKVRYYLERRDPEFEAKMAEVLCVYQEVAILRAAEANAPQVASEVGAAVVEQIAPNVAFVSDDEKPGIQAIANTAPDLPLVAGKYAYVARDHEHKRHGTLGLLTGSTCSPDKSMPASKTATARANSSVFSRNSRPGRVYLGAQSAA